MYADADRHGHEGIMLLCMDPHGMQPIVIQDAVVDPLRGGTVLVSLPPLCDLTHDRRVAPDVPARLESFRPPPTFYISEKEILFILYCFAISSVFFSNPAFENT